MQEEINKKKPFRIDLIILFIILILLGIVIFYFSKDASIIGYCDNTEDCEKYELLNIKGQGYVCANKEIMNEKSIKINILRFKYAYKNLVFEEPSHCSCIQNQCELN